MASISTSDELTPAQRLMQQHTAAAAASAHSHQPSVEEVVDEEDIAHPPPSSTLPSQTVGGASNTVNGQTPMSAKAAGKQRAADTANAPAPAARKGPLLDTQSEEAFPSLGAPKAKSSAASAWGSSKPAAVLAQSPTVSAPRSNGATAPGSALSSGFSTPAAAGARAGMTSPTYSNPRVPVQHMNLPGRYTERMPMPNSQIKKDLPKGLSNIIADMNRKNNAKIDMTRNDQQTVFTAQGPNIEVVQQALKDLAATIGAQEKIKVSVPASVRPHIIGKGGATIQGISKRTGAKVNVDKNDGQPIDQNDEDAIVDIVIEGNSLAVRLARNEVESIVGQRSANLSTRIKHIPPEYFPFLAGPHNARAKSLENDLDVRIKVPEYHTWSREPPQEGPAADQILQLSPQDGYHIQIAGDREAARQVQAQLEAQVRELERQLTLGQVQIEKDRHQFIIGERGASLHDFLDETGCSIILPPPGEDTEMITILGPPEQIEGAVNKVLDLAAAMSVANVDIARQHQNARHGPHAHARDLAKYMKHRRALEQFEQLYDSHVVFPPSMDKATAWQIYSREAKSAMKARSDLLNLVSAHPPSRFRNVNVHPFYQRHLTPTQAQLVRDQHGVHVVVPEEVDEPQVLLVYEGPGAASDYEFPRKQPTAAEVAQFETALAEAEQFIMGLIGQQLEIVQRSVDAPNKYREKLQRYVNREQRDREGEFPVQLLGLDGPVVSSGSEFPVEFRGPSSAVDDFAEKILAFVQEQIRDEAERDYTISFDFPQKFANFLIGKRGENINKLRDEFDVEIQVSDGKVDIKGPKAKADAAKAHILALGRKLEDETTHAVKINPKFHRELIGKSGAQIKRLEERYHVRINFPRSATADDSSVVDDGASEVNRRRGQAQAVDEVIIKGPRKGADEARDELLSLYQYIQDNSHIATVSVAQSQLPSLIGQGGRELESMRLATKADIDIPSKDVASANGRVEVRIKGTKAAVDAAKKLIETKAKVFDDTVIKSIQVNKKHHRALIGREGENIRQITVAAGAVGEPRELARMVQFPKADSADDSIRVEAHQQVVDRIVAAIESFVKIRESQVTESVEVAPERHGALIGRRGDTKKGIESEFNVTLTIPNVDTTGPARSLIKITGMPNDVENAKTRVLSMVKVQDGDKILVPIRFHHAIADNHNGAFFRNLHRDLQVTVDHAGHPKPTRPQTAAPPTRSVANGSAALPLITDDARGDGAALDPANSHAFDILAPPAAPESGEDPTIPWILKGASADNVAQAKAQILAALQDAQTQVIGRLVLPDPRWHRFVIGPAGSVINAIRNETGCKIDVPKPGGAGGSEAILIRGAEANVQTAKDKIIAAVEAGLENAPASGGRGRR